MHRVVEQLSCRRFFNYLPQIHDGYIIGKMIYYRKIVGYEKISNAVFFLQFFEQIKYLCLNRHVQSGYRLVAYDEFWIQGEGSGYSYTLAAASVKLMRIDVGQAGSQTYGFHQLGDMGSLFRL